jgi:hypothetical protein
MSASSKGVAHSGLHRKPMRLPCKTEQNLSALARSGGLDNARLILSMMVPGLRQIYGYAYGWVRKAP